MKHFNHVLAVLALVPLLSQAQKTKLQMTSDRRFVYSEKIINTSSGAVTLKKGSPPYNPWAYANVSGTIYYVRDNEPWEFSGTNNIALLDQAFGSGNYTVATYSIDPNVLFSSGTSIVYLEGSDANALALKAFLTASNRTLAQNWVSAGGRLFINAAPNEGGNINFGFGGTLLNYPESSFSSTGEIVPGKEGHPIFNEPFSPVGTIWSGNSFSHAYITGGPSKPLITGEAGPVLTELSYGSGIVLFGGMTTANWHEPQPEANNLRANIYAYLLGGINCSTPSNLRVTNITNASAKLHWVIGAGVSHVEIRYRKVGANQWTTLRRNATLNAITLNNLRANTTYQWQVRSCCTNKIKSSWIAGNNFKTKTQPEFSISAITADYIKVESKTNVQIAPNPNRGSFTIQIKLPAKEVSTTLSLYNNTGQKVWQENAGKIGGTLYKNISLGNKLSAGVYQLTIERSDIKLVQKIVIIK